MKKKKLAPIQKKKKIYIYINIYIYIYIYKGKEKQHSSLNSLPEIIEHHQDTTLEIPDEFDLIIERKIEEKKISLAIKRVKVY